MKVEPEYERGIRAPQELISDDWKVQSGERIIASLRLRRDVSKRVCDSS